MKYNSQAFTTEEIKKGMLTKFLNTLLELSDSMEKSYLDIHIVSDGYCQIVEWSDVSFEYGGGKFQFVDEDEVIAKEVRFPDSHYEYVFSEEDEKEAWERFHKENPGWVKTEYGGWTNEIDNAEFKKYLESNKEDENTEN